MGSLFIKHILCTVYFFWEELKIKHWSVCILPLQVNIGILISVTRIISRISGESYKIHGDANAVKYDFLFIYSFDFFNQGLTLAHIATYVFCFRLTVKAVAVLLPILGISWIFGILAVNSQSLAFLYIFAIFNSLQVRLFPSDLIFHPTASEPLKKKHWLPFFLILGVLCLFVSLSSKLWGTDCEFCTATLCRQ